METITSNMPKKSKYAQGLEELENLKRKAKENKPKRASSFFFINILLTFLLLFVLFIIGFGISYNNSLRKFNQNSARYIPNAQITLPKEPGSKCQLAIELTNQKNEGQLNCQKARTSEDCLSVDMYNETTGNFTGADSKPDCIWKE